MTGAPTGLRRTALLLVPQTEVSTVRRTRWQLLIFLVVAAATASPSALVRLTGRAFFAGTNLHLHVYVPSEVLAQGSPGILTRPFVPNRSTLQVSLYNGSGRPVVLWQQCPEVDYDLTVTPVGPTLPVPFDDSHQGLPRHDRYARYVLPPDQELTEVYDLRTAHRRLPPGEYLMKMRRQVHFGNPPDQVTWVESPPIHVRVWSDLALTQH